MRWFRIALLCTLSACAHQDNVSKLTASCDQPGCETSGFASTNSIILRELWTVKGAFNQPESAVFDPVSKQIFVSNVNGYAKDGNGFVSSVSADGQQLELHWLDGLNSPTGLTVAGDYLYIVDYDQLLKVEIHSKQIIKRYAAPHERPALNDVLVTSRGDVLVTGSASSAIYRVENDALVVWKQDAELLRLANGLFENQGELLLGGAKWVSFNLASGAEIANNIDLTEIDGIASDGCGGLIVTLLNDNRLWWLARSANPQPLSQNAIDGIDLSHHDKNLFVPRVGGSLSVYALSHQHCQPEMGRGFSGEIK